MDQIERIRNEILELRKNSQGRRTYSESVKSEILSLKDQGMSLKLIAEQTGIHVTTIHSWFAPVKLKSKFKEVQISSDIESEKSMEIRFSSGATIVHLTIDDLIEILKLRLLS